MDRKFPTFLSSVLIISALSASPAHASESPGSIIVDSINREKGAISLTWLEIEGAQEYVLFEEMVKSSSLVDPGEPVYRGADLGFAYRDLDEGEVVRLRILALDDEENVLARSLLRTSTPNGVDFGGDVTWIANSAGVEITVGDGLPEDAHSLREGLSVSFGSVHTEPADAGIKVSVPSHDENQEENYEISTTGDAEASWLEGFDLETSPEEVGYNWNVEVASLGADKSHTLEGERNNVREALVNATYSMLFGWDAFLGEQYIPLPALCVMEEEADGNVFFGGDNRAFGMDDIAGIGTSRVNLFGGVYFSQPRFEYNQITQEYEFAEFQDPHIREWLRMGLSTAYEQQDDGTMEQIASEFAPIDELGFEEIGVNETRGTFQLTSNASLPLCEIFGEIPAPAIDISLSAELDSDGTYFISGYRDSAPNHQATVTRRYGKVFPAPTREEATQVFDNPMMKCIERHESLGVPWLAAPPEPVTFSSDTPENYAPDCSDPV